MIKAKFIVTHDETGDWKTPDRIANEYEKEFETAEELWEWETRQNGHPWFTTHLVHKEEVI